MVKKFDLISKTYEFSNGRIIEEDYRNHDDNNFDLKMYQRQPNGDTYQVTRLIDEEHGVDSYADAYNDYVKNNGYEK